MTHMINSAQPYGRYRTRTYGLFLVRDRMLENSQAVGIAGLSCFCCFRPKGDSIAAFGQRTRVRSPKDDQTAAEPSVTMLLGGAGVAPKESS